MMRRLLENRSPTTEDILSDLASQNHSKRPASTTCCGTYLGCSAGGEAAAVDLPQKGPRPPGVAGGKKWPLNAAAHVGMAGNYPWPGEHPAIIKNAINRQHFGPGPT